MQHIQKLLPQSKYGRLTLFTVFLQSIIVILLESFVGAFFLTYFNALGAAETDLQRGVPVYIFIFVLAQFFEVGLMWDAVTQSHSL